MPQVLVWQCPKTKKYFSDKKKYIKHLRLKAAENIELIKMNKIKNSIQDKFAEMRMLHTVDEISQWICDNSEVFLINSLIYSDMMYTIKNFQMYKNFKFTAVEFLNFRYNVLCSNTHSAPKGKPTNWHRESNLPVGFPGWNARVIFKFSDTYPRFFSDLMKNSGIHTGSGGGGGDFYSADVTLFSEEWSGLTTEHIFNKLANE